MPVSGHVVGANIVRRRAASLPGAVDEGCHDLGMIHPPAESPSPSSRSPVHNFRL